MVRERECGIGFECPTKKLRKPVANDILLQLTVFQCYFTELDNVRLCLNAPDSDKTTDFEALR